MIVLLSTTEFTVYVPVTLGVVTPFKMMVAPACGAPWVIEVTMVMFEPTGAGVDPASTVTVAMSLFGQKSVPEDHKRPFPD